MFEFLKVSSPSSIHRFTLLLSILKVCFLAVVVCLPLSAFAQGSPFDNGFTALQTLFTGTIAKVASLP
jgi:type IV secretory pathway VirB2 component (pilin)